MAIEWHSVGAIRSNYPFKVARLGDRFIVTDDDYFTNLKSVTNNIEEIIEHIILGCSRRESERIEIYQLTTDGVFKLDWFLKRKVTRVMPPWEISDIKWQFISKDLSTFEVLYG